LFDVTADAAAFDLVFDAVDDEEETPSAALHDLSVFANPDDEVDEDEAAAPAAGSSVDDDVDEENSSDNRLSFCIGKSSQSLAK
jgi:hypothetical protein